MPLRARRHPARLLAVVTCLAVGSASMIACGGDGDDEVSTSATPLDRVADDGTTATATSVTPGSTPVATATTARATAAAGDGTTGEGSGDGAGDGAPSGPIRGRDIGNDALQRPGGRGAVAPAPPSGPLVDGSSGSGRPALVVKIDNAPGAWPQAGLNQADVVFEVLVEGMSRFAAVFQTTDAAVVGPIRSARTSDLNLVAQLGRPLFAWSGGNSGVRAAVATSSVVDIGADTSPGAYYRADGFRVIPHNLMSSTLALRAAGSGASGPAPIFSYASSSLAVPTTTPPPATVRTTTTVLRATSTTRMATSSTTTPVSSTPATPAAPDSSLPPSTSSTAPAPQPSALAPSALAPSALPVLVPGAVGGDPALAPVGGVEIEIGGTRSMFLWDASVGRWRRYQSGWAHLDTADVQVTPTNVVVLETEYLPSPADARSPEAHTVGSGAAWVLVDGAAVAGRWERDAAGAPYRLIAHDGRPIRLSPGRTWVSLPPPGGSVRFLDEVFAAGVLGG